MITFLISAIKIIFLLGFLIGIHETGHFLIAKLCKVKVNEFAIGFGPVIWKKQGKETKYELRLIPLGGFVNMEGEEERSDKEGSFSNAPIPKRIAIVAAGAVVNIVFAIIVYFILATTSINTTSNVVSNLQENYASQTAGIEVGDKILKINNKKIVTSTDINEVLNKSQGEEVTVLIERNGEKKEIKLSPTEVKYQSVGIYLQSLEEKSTEIAAVEPGSVAEKQGLQAGDEIIKINGQEVQGNPEKLLEIFQGKGNSDETVQKKNAEDSNNNTNILEENSNSNLNGNVAESSENEIMDNAISYKLLIKRAGKELEVELVPETLSNYYLGVKLAKPEDTFANRLYYAMYNTKEFLFSIVDNVKNLFIGKVSTAQLTGPVGISEVVVKTNGIKEFIYILALISISLGVTNLLPFPPLDGGKILLLIIEAIRKKPLKEETEIKIQLLGFAVLIGVSILITYNDIIRIL